MVGTQGMIVLHKDADERRSIPPTLIWTWFFLANSRGMQSCHKNWDIIILLEEQGHGLCGVMLLVMFFIMSLVSPLYLHTRNGMSEHID